MPYFLAAILIGALGAPAASALPSISPHSLATSKADPIIQAAAKRKPAPSRSSSKRGNSGGGASSGIHPLVGSGEY